MENTVDHKFVSYSRDRMQLNVVELLRDQRLQRVSVSCLYWTQKDRKSLLCLQAVRFERYPGLNTVV